MAFAWLLKRKKNVGVYSVKGKDTPLLLGDGAVPENLYFFSSGLIPWRVCYTFFNRLYKARRGSSSFCVGNYLNHLGCKIAQIGLSRASCWIGKGAYKPQLGQIGFGRPWGQKLIKTNLGQIGL